MELLTKYKDSVNDFKHFLSKINTLFEITVYALFYSVLASGDFCRLLINFANSFDPYQTVLPSNCASKRID